MTVSDGGACAGPRDAALDAETAAKAAEVDVRPLTSRAEIEAAAAVITSVWGSPGGGAPLGSELLTALAHSEDYVAGAFDRTGLLVAVSVGFFGPPAHAMLHSHATAAGASSRNRGVGLALKLHQRAWALERGATRITWTFDPLMSRNAFFNVERLGAGIAEYLPNFYGAMSDPINGSEESDRLLADWDITAPRPRRGESRSVDELVAAGAVVALRADASGTPVLVGESGATVLVQIPLSIEELRATSPFLDRAWRYAVRDVLGGLIDAGAHVVGFLRAGYYVVEAQPAPGA